MSFFEEVAGQKADRIQAIEREHPGDIERLKRMIRAAKERQLAFEREMATHELNWLTLQGFTVDKTRVFGHINERNCNYFMESLPCQCMYSIYTVSW